MIVTSQPKVFSPISVEFNNEAELHDVIAVIAAYTRKSNVVHGTDIAEEFGLTAYTGNARVTANRVLGQLVEAIG